MPAAGPVRHDRVSRSRRPKLTLVWFAIWLVANVLGDNETLSADPVNWWTGTLILAVAIDLNSRHVVERSRSGKE